MSETVEKINKVLDEDNRTRFQKIRDWIWVRTPPNPIRQYFRRKYWKAYDEGFMDALEGLKFHGDITKEIYDEYKLDDRFDKTLEDLDGI